MKFSIGLLSLFLAVSCSAQNTAGIAKAETASTVKELPKINQKMIAYVEKNKGKKILRGECWDVVKMALTESGANWTPPTDFGKVIELKDALPGDVVMFENTVFKGEGYSQSFGGHYAVVHSVNEDGTITLAHQNYNKVRKIRFDNVTPAHLVKGKLTFFRPQG